MCESQYDNLSLLKTNKMASGLYQNEGFFSGVSRSPAKLGSFCHIGVLSDSGLNSDNPSNENLLVSPEISNKSPGHNLTPPVPQRKQFSSPKMPTVAQTNGSVHTGPPKTNGMISSDSGPGGRSPSPALRTLNGPGRVETAIRELTGYVGFANIPNQVYRKAIKRGFHFTLMVVGKGSTLFRRLHVATRLFATRRTLQCRMQLIPCDTPKQAIHLAFAGSDLLVVTREGAPKREGDNTY